MLIRSLRAAPRSRPHASASIRISSGFSSPVASFARILAQQPASRAGIESGGYAMPSVAVVMGSKSDAPVVQECLDLLDRLEISYECTVASAHRTPDLVRELTLSAPGRGVEVFIAAAGGAAALPGVIKSPHVVTGHWSSTGQQRTARGRRALCYRRPDAAGGPRRGDGGRRE